MSIAVLFDPVEMTHQTYRRVVETLKNDGEWPPQGLCYHAAFGDSGHLRIFEVWESVYDMEKFGARLRVVLADHGVAPASALVSELVAVETVTDLSS